MAVVYRLIEMLIKHMIIVLVDHLDSNFFLCIYMYVYIYKYIHII